MLTQWNPQTLICSRVARTTFQIAMEMEEDVLLIVDICMSYTFAEPWWRPR
jgi:hypothetical protein